MASKAQTSLSVAVRVRPMLKSEQAGSNKRDIIRVIDDKIVVVLDPDEIKDYLDQVQNRTKEKNILLTWLMTPRWATQQARLRCSVYAQWLQAISS